MVLALIYLGMQGGIQRQTYKRAELSWVYEDNFSRKLIAAGGKIYKTYRIYEKLYEGASYWSKRIYRLSLGMSFRAARRSRCWSSAKIKQSSASL